MNEINQQKKPYMEMTTETPSASTMVGGPHESPPIGVTPIEEVKPPVDNPQSVNQSDPNKKPEEGVNPAEKTPAQNPEVYEIGGQKFESPEALLSHAKALQEKIDAQPPKSEQAKEIVEQVVEPAQSDPSVTDVDNELLALTNPEEHERRIIARVKGDLKSEIFGELDAREGNRVFWENFYRDNPELDGFKDLVDIVHQQHSGELKELSVFDGKKRLETLTKDLFTRIKDSANTSEVQEGKVHALSPSGDEVPGGAPRVVEEAPKNFLDQIASLRDKPPRR